MQSKDPVSPERLASSGGRVFPHSAAGLVLSKQLSRRSAARLVLEIDLGQLRPGAVYHNETGFRSTTDHGGGKWGCFMV
jgi:hypothetical protein